MADGRNGRIERSLIAADDGDRGALLGKQMSGGEAITRISARDEGNFYFKFLYFS